MRLFSGRQRPFHLGPYPMEVLRRIDTPPSLPDARPGPGPVAPQRDLGAAVAPLAAVFDTLLDGDVASARAPLPAGPVQRARLVKSAAHFFDAAVAGVCAHGDRYALVLAVEPGRLPEADNPAHAWIGGAQDAFLAMRAAEIAQVLAAWLRAMGFAARAHSATSDTAPLAELAVRAGVAVWLDGELHNPFLDTGFGLAAVTTELELSVDRPLAVERGGALAQAGLAWALGTRGTRSALTRWQERRRASHMSRYPMERIRRVDAPTTRVDDDEIPQVPLRASFFNRAASGDLGAKAQAQFPNFVMKEPLSRATRDAQGRLIALQDGEVAAVESPPVDPQRNARGVKSLGYYLGTDLVGICQVPRYAWYSHDARGEPITEHHRNAIVLLIDQGYETMEGASGDDWISGGQSMRAYLRGMEIATLMAAQIRSLGYRARAHSNTDGQVLQIPLILKAGLGELSRIGEVVLNPFVGPRFKSAIVSTDMPLAVDRHIDFGLQDMCSKCRKCARECPCNAISWGEKVMFNGYEMWKPDVERCTRYRLTNARGSACGRCMKTCPYNHEGLLGHQLMLRLAIAAPWSRRFLARLDDGLGHGRRNPVKKWWADVEIVDGVPSAPRAGANARDLNLGKHDPGVPIAYYNAADMPPGNRSRPLPVDRKAAIDAVRLIETPAEAARRRAAGGSAPAHYAPPEV